MTDPELGCTDAPRATKNPCLCKWIWFDSLGINLMDKFRIRKEYFSPGLTGMLDGVLLPSSVAWIMVFATEQRPYEGFPASCEG